MSAVTRTTHLLSAIATAFTAFSALGPLNTYQHFQGEAVNEGMMRYRLVRLEAELYELVQPIATASF